MAKITVAHVERALCKVRALRHLVGAICLVLAVMTTGAPQAQAGEPDLLQGLAYSEAASARLSPAYVADMKALGVRFVGHDKPWLPLGQGNTTVVTVYEERSFKSDTMRNLRFKSWRNVIDLRGRSPRVYMSTLPEAPTDVHLAVKVLDRVLLPVITTTREEAERRKFRDTGTF